MSDLFSSIETVLPTPHGPVVRRPAPATAHHDDPPTSAEAAHRMNRTGKVTRDQAKVLAILRANPHSTACELFHAQGAGSLDRYDFSKRLPELERAGLVARKPARRCRVNGTNQATWLALDDPQPTE